VQAGKERVMSEYWDRYFGVGLDQTDPDIERLIRREEERQASRLILIPSESIAPQAVREALGSVFNNVYAEGYPALRMTQEDEESLLDFDFQGAYHRRYGDRRFYQGTENVNIVESLAQRRCADALANDRVASEDLFVNVQALSGAAANLAVYEALLSPGDTIMSMGLFTGGHLTHGSRANVSGQRYNVVSYGVGKDGRLDYDAILDRAKKARPRIIVAGFTSYPWAPDWAKFREIADAVGAYLMADIAHTLGLAIAGAYPSPVGYADVITATTHKTLCGPRGAIIITADRGISRKINAAVFPGLQGGPHPNKMAAIAVAFRIAQTDEFKRMMFRITENAAALAASLEKRGLQLAYGGTDTHLLLIDLRALGTAGDLPVRGETAVSVLELAGIVTNKNTIPGDKSTAVANSVRLGTPWVTQRGMGPAEMDRIAGCIARLLDNLHPFCPGGPPCEVPRAQVDFDVLEEVRAEVASLVSGAPTDVPAAEPRPAKASAVEGRSLLLVSGPQSRSFLEQAGTASLARLAPGGSARTLLLDADSKLIGDVHVARLARDAKGHDRFLLLVPQDQADRVRAWLQGLSDGYVVFDREDDQRKVEGPVAVVPVSAGELSEEMTAAVKAWQGAGLPAPLTAGADALVLYQEGHQELFALTKPYFVGQAGLRSVLPAGQKPEFVWQPPAEETLKRTVLYEEHRKLGGKVIPFAGWEMPVWYSSVSEEHRAVRQAAGLFDVSHMGLFEVTGEDAVAFLDLVGSNHAAWLQVGQSQYTYLLNPDGSVIDDVMTYYIEPGRYMLVVNASNNDKDWAWLNAVNEGRVTIDRDNAAMEFQGRAKIRDLRDPASGADQLLDIALQGPKSLRILLQLADDDASRKAIAGLRRADVTPARVAGIQMFVARTGYTGESLAYELFLHPDFAVQLWNTLLEAGKEHGIRPCGLASRDSTRTEAGLPLYGHELDGPMDIVPQEAGFAGFLKAHKPFYIGRKPVMERAAASTRQLVRFQVDETGQRALRGGEHGEPVLNRRGSYIGRVTTAALVEGVQIGMALVDRRHAEVGTPLYIYPSAAKVPSKAPADLDQGDSVVLPIAATVVSRFPTRGRSGSAGDE
jgi:glycine hydroxymethyltransferase